MQNLLLAAFIVAINIMLFLCGTNSLVSLYLKSKNKGRLSEMAKKCLALVSITLCVGAMFLLAMLSDKVDGLNVEHPFLWVLSPGIIYFALSELAYKFIHKRLPTYGSLMG